MIKRDSGVNQLIILKKMLIAMIWFFLVAEI